MKNKIINITICVILFIIPLLTLPKGLAEMTYNIPKYVALLICGVILLVLIILKRKELKFDRIDKTLLIFYILILISMLFSFNIKKAIIGEANRFEGVLTFTIYFMVYYCAKYFFQYNKKLKTLAIITVCISSIIGILQYYNIFPLYYIYNIFNIPYRPGFASSTFGNTNFFGSFLAICVPVFMALYLIKEKRCYLVLSYISFWAMLSSATRSSWFGLAFATIFGIIYVIKNHNKELLKRVGIIAIGFIIIFGIMLIPPKFLPEQFQYGLLSNRLDLLNEELHSMFIEQNVESSFGSGRFQIWSSVLKVIKATPLIGCGPDNLKEGLIYYALEDTIYQAEVYNRYVDKAHNEYLQIGATIGIPALIVYLAFIGQILYKERNMFKNKATFILVIPILGYLAQAFFNISTIGVAPIFWFLLGIIQNEEFKNSLINKDDNS